MATKTDILEVVITATDDASPKLEGLGKVLGGIGSVAGGVLTAGLGAAATGTGLLVSSIDSGTEALARMERISAQTAAAIESTGGAAGVTVEQIEEMSNALESSTATSAESTQEAANLLLTFTSIGGDVFPQATQAIVDMARAMDKTGSAEIDMSGQAIMLGKALQDPIAGVGALSRVGVNFNEETKATIKNFVEMGDVASAQKIILNELAVEFGGSGEAFAKTTAGMQEQTADAFEDLQKTLAGPFLALSGEVFSSLTTMLKDLTPVVEVVGQTLGDAISGMLPMLTEVGSTLLSGVVAPLLQLGGTVLAQVVPVFAQLLTALAPVVTMLATEFAAVLTQLISALLPGLTALLPIVAQVLGVVIQAFMQLFQAIIPILPPLLQLISAILGPLAELFTGVITAIMPLITTILGVLIDLITMVIEAIMPLLMQILPPLAELFTKLIMAIAPLLEAILPVLSELIGLLIQILTPLLELLMPLFIFLIEGLITVLDRAMPPIRTFSNWIQDRVVPAIESIGRAIAPVIDWIRRMADQLASITIPDWLTPGSPTPFELGLRGIGDAARDLATMQLPKMAASLLLPGGLAGGIAGSNIAGGGTAFTTFAVEYSPMVSMADADEFENRLKPLIDKVIREYNRGTQR